MKFSALKKHSTNFVSSLCAIATILWSLCFFTPCIVTAGTAQNDPGSMRRIVIPMTKDCTALDLCVARTKVVAPTAVVVLCMNYGQDAKALLSEPAWVKFVETNQLALFAIADPSAASLAAKHMQSTMMASHIFQAIDAECGHNLPLLLYCCRDRTGIMENLLAANPRRIAGWCIYSPTDQLFLQKAMSAGLIASHKADPITSQTAFQSFTRGRKGGNVLTWLNLNGTQPGNGRLPSLEDFTRDYFVGLLKSKPVDAQWQDVETKRTMTVAELNTRAVSADYLPSAALIPKWLELHIAGTADVPTEQAIIEREVDTLDPDQPKLHLYLRLPTGTGTAASKVKGVLAFCSMNDQRTKLIAALQNRRDFLVAYAEDHHLALLTWDTAIVYNNAKSADELERKDAAKANTNFNYLADAWVRGVHVLCHDTGLPETDFLLYGMSRGAQWAHRLALRKPDHFLAVHIHVCSSYDAPTLAAKNILWLQTTGDRDVGYEPSKRFYHKCRDLGYPVIFKAGENLGHINTADLENLGLRFFDYALLVKAKRDAATARTDNFRTPSSVPDLYTLSGLGHAPLYADFINQDVYRADQKEMIPPGQRVPLPTDALARAWQGSNDAVASLQPVVNTLVQVPMVAGSVASTLVLPTPPQPNANSDAKIASPNSTPSANPTITTDGLRGEEHPPTPTPQRENLSIPPRVSEDFFIKNQLAVQFAVARYPDLAHAESAFNQEFVKEYRKLKESDSPKLSDPYWPEQVAHTIADRLGIKPVSPK